MLTAIKERATGWIAWGIIIFITVPFVLWGIQSYFKDTKNKVPIATVNGSEISFHEYQNELSRQRQVLVHRFGENFDHSLLDSLVIKFQVINNLIDNYLFQEYTADQNYRISDEQLNRIISSNPSFMEDGKFSQRLYFDILTTNRLSAQKFEAFQRQQGAIAQLQNGIINSGFTMTSELEQLLSLYAQRRVTDYVILKVNQFESEFSITDGEIKQYYNNNINNYQAPARIMVDYVELSVKALMESIDPTEEEIQAIYEQTSSQYKQDETRKASHILFTVNSVTSSEEKQEIEKEARLILKRAQSGEDFAELVKKFSNDQGSKNNGGDLGIITRGQMVQPFEDAVFDMQEGEIRGLVESSFGFHIIKLTELKPGRQQILEEVKEEVIEETKRLKSENLFTELGKSFQNLVFEDPENLTTVADELNLPILTSDWFTESQGEGVAAYPQVRKAAFKEDVLNEGLVSQSVQIGFDTLIAVQKKEYEASRTIDLDEVQEDIAATIRTERAKEKVLEIGEELLSGFDNGSSSTLDWNNFVQEQQFKVLILPELRSEIPPHLQNLGNAVFSHTVPENQKYRVGGVVLPDGNYAIYALKSVHLANPSTVDSTHKTRLEQQLISQGGVNYVQLLRDHIRENAEVSIAEDRL